MRIGDVKNHVMEALSARRTYLLDQRDKSKIVIKDEIIRMKMIDDELEGIAQTEYLINTASNRGD